ncbi:MAG: EAL domain-containing protein, partial [Oceanobacter sp.]
VAINLTGYRLNKGSFNEDLQELLRRTGCSPDAIEIEITEEYIVQRAESALKDLDHLREMGVRIAVDDFGTGYSSLSYLKELPVDKLKIDRSFICDLEKSSGGQKIITALLAMARELDLAVVAEGVETEQQKQFLQERGCHSVQGYFFSQPITADELTAMVSAQNVVQMKKEQRP